MRCSFCGHQESKVVDSRQSDDANKTRRRRECLGCGKRFTTYEIRETIPLIVVKRDKSREVFDSQKLVKGLMSACSKRPVSIEELESIVSEIEAYYSNKMLKEVNATEIGEKVMELLKEVDQISYVRFASVYKEFKDVDSFLYELEKLKLE